HPFGRSGQGGGVVDIETDPVDPLVLGSAAGAGGQADGLAPFGELLGDSGADGAGTGDEVGGHEELLIVVVVGAHNSESTAHTWTVLLRPQACQEQCSLLFHLLAFRAGPQYPRR